jgi:hypothetical protein
MKKANFKYLPLLLLPVTGCLLIPYLSGRGVVSDGLYLIVFFGCAYLLPIIISLVIVPLLVEMRTKGSGWKVGACLFGTLAVQYALTLPTLPAGREWIKILGVAHRLEVKFSLEEIRKCADDFRRKDKEGVLIFQEDSKKSSGLLSGITRVVNEAQLPADLRGRFYCVRIGKEDRMTGDVFFEVEQDWGILCSTNNSGDLNGRQLMVNGVYAYYYRRL